MMIGIAAAALAAASTPSGDLSPRSISFGGQARQWSEYIPASCVRPVSPCMTVLFLHGGSPAELRNLLGRRAERTPEQLAQGTGMLAAAQRDGFILLIPKALNGNWNDGRRGIAQGTDDVGFLRAMLADVGRRARVSPERTFSTGVSNGGMMSFRLVCEASDVVRAIGPVVANMSNDLSKSCLRGRPVDIVQVLGQADPLMKYQGGTIAWGRGGTMSAADTLDYWSARLSAPTRSEQRLNQEVTLRTVTAKDGRIAQYSLLSYGHGWPGADGQAAGGAGLRRGGMMQQLRGSNPTNFSATETVLAFFKATPPRR